MNVLYPQLIHTISKHYKDSKSLVRTKIRWEVSPRNCQGKAWKYKAHQALTNIAIPTFDIKKQPTIFSSYETLIAIGETTKQIMRGSSDYFAIKQLDYARLLVISLGTGAHKEEEKYDANGAAKWGLLGWLTNSGSTPLVDVFTQASADMVDYHLSVIFQALHSEKNYLRIQKPVARLNLETGLVESSDQETNEQAVRRFAKLLSDEKRLRDIRSPSPHGYAKNPKDFKLNLVPEAYSSTARK
ncbi:hypothetical protein RHMOL_Rhmol06G0059100 [Rhododendron molle]|uniref:Uncharacterized protein n=1 Tax=Rhododendron molle TaxID=49168 RepID=A0ACC0NAF8_RHOML|nr:hypothetical protein RHMOL_Rhmol06G0059100 [Rhododendron molle]